MEKVAIIGMGIAGMGTLVAYNKQKEKHNITCYDMKTSFGRGFPFRKDSNDVLLNVRPNDVSFDFDKPGEFEAWLHDNKYDYKEYVPRHVYGSFMKEKTEALIKEMNATEIIDQVTDCLYLNDSKQFKIITQSGLIEVYDRVHLCCGVLPPNDFYQLNGQSQYIGQIYPVVQRLNDIKQTDSVGVIGTSLSAIDVTRYLLKNNKAQNVVMFSIDNVFPTVRQERLELKINYFTIDAIQTIRNKQNDTIQFKQVDELLDKEFKEHNLNLKELIEKYSNGFNAIQQSLIDDKQLSLIQSLTVKLFDSFNVAWFGMNKQDKKAFSDKYQLMIQLFGSPTPKETGLLLEEMVKQGRISVIENAFEVNKNKETGLFEIINETNKTQQVAASVNWMVNATGLDMSFESLNQNSLINKLLNQELLSKSEHGGILVLEDKFQVVSPKFGSIENLHAHGVLIAGVQLSNNSTNTIQASANRVTQRIVVNNS